MAWLQALGLQEKGFGMGATRRLARDIASNVEAAFACKATHEIRAWMQASTIRCHSLCPHTSFKQ